MCDRVAPFCNLFFPPFYQIPAWVQELPIDDEMKQIFVKERIDEAAYVLLSEEDLKELGFPLGPRKKLVEDIKKRQA